MKTTGIKKTKDPIAVSNDLTSLDLAIAMHTSRLIVAYGGLACHDLNTRILESVEHTLVGQQERRRVRKRVINVLIECTGNLTLHACDKVSNNMLYNSALTIKQTPTQYIINVSNTITEEEIAPLKKRLEFINKLDDKELQHLYAETLTKSEQSDKGGAGLGLMDIAKRSSEKLAFQFHQLENNSYLFSLNVIINRFSEN